MCYLLIFDMENLPLFLEILLNDTREVYKKNKDVVFEVV